MSAPVHVRAATAADLPAIDAIYEHYIRTTHVTFDVEPWPPGRREQWFAGFAPAGRHRLVVAEAASEVLGYACTTGFRPKRAYETSVETSVYVRDDAGGRGIGSALYRALFDLLAGEDVHRAYAGIALPNDASVALHERFGFVRAGLFTEQGRKFGRYWDVAWYERHMDDTPHTGTAQFRTPF